MNAAEIGVIARSGVITLTGTVDRYAKKVEAEEAAKKVGGVKAMVEKIDIKFKGTCGRVDNEIATEVIDALTVNWEVPQDKVNIKLEKGWVNLEGQVQWDYQKEAAKNAVKNLAGLLGVTSNIMIKPEATDEIEKEAIVRALGSNWSINEEDTQVKVSANQVTLTGIFVSVYQKDEAGRLAWNAPGVSSVDNELVIEYDYIAA